MASTNALCDQCNSSGLPIMPVRYTAVPNAVQPGLPSWAGGNRVTSVALGSEFKYALRTLRQGYVYIFYDKNRRGSNQWECYSVCQDGCMKLQPTPQAAQPQNLPTFQCGNSGHNNVLVRYIVIEEPKKCSTAWIAFSQHKWSDETLKEYTGDVALRNKRMQTIHPAALAGGAKHSHAAIAEQAALEGVLEYAPAFHERDLPFGGNVPEVSKEDGSLQDPTGLARVSTRFPWAMRQGQAESTAKSMKARGEPPHGKPNTPHVIALWDAIGIAHELNGYRNDVAGWIKKYGEERQFQIDALNDYDGLKVAMTSRAGQQQQQAQDQIAQNASASYDPAALAQRRASAQSLPEPQRSRELQVIGIQESWGQRGVPTTTGYGIRLNEANALAEPVRTQQINAVQADVDKFMQTRAGNCQKNIDRAEAGAWPNYQDRIADVAGTFRKKQTAFNKQAAALIDQRTPALIHWLEARLFIDTLNDFHGQNIEDGLLFDEAVSEAMFGMGSCKAGAAKIETWVKECKATVDDNLLWRVLALNQHEARQELDQVLAEAKRHKDQQTLAQQLTWASYTTKLAKVIADTYKKAQGVYDGNTRAGSQAGSVVFGSRLKPVNMRGIDKAVITFGDAVFKAFRIDKLADYASEKIIQHIFSVRAFVTLADSANLILKQAQSEGLLREQTLKRLRTARTFLAADTPPIKSAQAEALAAEWGKFKAGTGDAKLSAVKDARLALVVGLIEGMNFAKLMADCETKGDKKSWWSLLASGMSITSAMFDISATVAKNLPSMGNASWGYQGLKMWGGVLSGGASFIGGTFDLIEAGNDRDQGYGNLWFLYSIKGWAGLGSSALTLAVAFTYSAPLVARLTGNAAVGIVVRNVGEKAAAFIALRVFGMAAGGWITVGAFGVQVVIWIITPDALEKWIDHSAFGNKRSDGGYKTAQEQERKLKEGLVEMGLAQ